MEAMVAAFRMYDDLKRNKTQTQCLSYCLTVYVGTMQIHLVWKIMLYVVEKIVKIC